MSLSVKRYWNYLQSNDLLSRNRLKSTKAFVKTQTAGNANFSASQLGTWLVAQSWLTDYQNRILLGVDENRPAGPLFQFGPFQTLDQLNDAALPEHYLCRLAGNASEAKSNESSTSDASSGIPQSPGFLLSFVAKANDQDWQAIGQRVEWYSKIEHPHLVGPSATLELSDYRAVVEAEYCGRQEDYRSLAEQLASGSKNSKANVGPVGVKQALTIIADVAWACSHLHQQGGTHGLVNPSVVILNRSGRAALRMQSPSLLKLEGLAEKMFSGLGPRENDPKLAFGLDQPVDALLPLGWSPADFLAPEQMESLSQSSAASDLYGLGCLLFYSLAGSIPFPGADWQEKLAGRSSSSQNESLTKFLPSGCPKLVSEMLLILLQASPQKRTLTAAKLAAKLYAVVQLQPSAAAIFQTHDAAVAAKKWCQDQSSLCIKVTSELSHGVDKSLASKSLRDSSDKDLITVPNFDFTGRNVANNPIVISGESATGRQRIATSQNQPAWLTWVIGSGAAVLIAALIAGPYGVGLYGVTASKDANGADGKKNLATDVPAEPVIAASTTAWTQELVKDDGKMLWQSPTVGFPVEIESIPSNPAAMLIIDKGFWENAPVEKLVAAIDGMGDSTLRNLVDDWKQRFSLTSFDRLVVAQYQVGGKAQHAVWLQANKPVTLKLAGWKAIAKLDRTDSVSIEGGSRSTTSNDLTQSLSKDPSGFQKNVEGNQPSEISTAGPAKTSAPFGGRFLVSRTASDRSIEVALVTAAIVNEEFWNSLPSPPLDRLNSEMMDPELADTTLVDDVFMAREVLVTSPDLMTIAISEGGRTSLTLPFSTALACSDQDRQLQLVVNPVMVWNEIGKAWLGPRWEWLAALVKNELSTDLRCVFASLHYDQDDAAYFETKFITDRAKSNSTAITSVVANIQLAGPMVEKGLLDLPRIKYWENALLRYDDMIENVSAAIRIGLHDDVPTLNAWLAPNSVQNLVATTALYFTAMRYSGVDGSMVAAKPKTPQTLAQLLQIPRDLSIPEQDLVNALSEMVTEIKASYPDLPFELKIDLDGNQLRLDGITQNQKITDFKLKQAPLSEILSALVVKANANAEVTSAKDPKCKLTWLVDPNRSTDTILVTTRAAAKKNNWQLPPEVAVE